MTSGTNISNQNPSRFEPIECYKTSPHDDLLGTGWTTVYDHDCDFDAEGFFQVTHFLIRNPNINTPSLVRADILYDSDGTENIDAWVDSTPGQQLKKECPDIKLRLSPHHKLKRRIVRRFIPRNDGLDKPTNQSVLYYGDVSGKETKKKLVILIPHIQDVDEMPLYHPDVSGIAFTHVSGPDSSRISISYRQFKEDSGQPFSDRQIRTAYHLLKTTWKYGHGNLAGYKKRVHNDHIVPQKQVQDRFVDLKRKYATRLIASCTEPGKQVFEQVGIAAFLLELWSDMYQDERFPGFVDIGCGNGILVEILLSEGYTGYGLEGYRRNTWTTLSPRTQRALVHAIVVPAPLHHMDDQDIKYADYRVTTNPRPEPIHNIASVSGKLRLLSMKITGNGRIKEEPALPPVHNGLFNSTPESIEGPFLISNHADELTAWTPFLALLNRSSFFIIPCCSRNLCGERFRTPSHVNNFTADELAPPYFHTAKSKPATSQRRKHISIHIPDVPTRCDKAGRDNGNTPIAQQDDSPRTGSSDFSEQSGLICRVDKAQRHYFVNATPLAVLLPPTENTTATPKPSTNGQAAETGDLEKLSQKVRTKNLSGYQALCCWIVHLADKCGYLVEREMLRLPSTRGFGIVGRFMKGEFELEDEEDNTTIHPNLMLHERMKKVIELIKTEGGAQRSKWIAVCENDVVRRNDLSDHGA